MLRFQLFKVGVNDGIRTRDKWNHNPGLYQLSYSHHNFFTAYFVVRGNLTTAALAHKINGAPDRIRT